MLNPDTFKFLFWLALGPMPAVLTWLLGYAVIRHNLHRVEDDALILAPGWLYWLLGRPTRTHAAAGSIPLIQSGLQLYGLLALPTQIALYLLPPAPTPDVGLQYGFLAPFFATLAIIAILYPRDDR